MAHNSGSTQKPLRLAVYGFVEKEAGGLASANHILLERLLARGHFVELYAIDPFVRPEGLFAYPNLRYRGFRLPAVEAGWKAVSLLPGRPRRVAQHGYSQFVTFCYYRAINQALLRARQQRRYDALLTLGLLSPFRVPGLPTVSWTQGTPNGERQALVAEKGRLVRLCGWPLYAGLTAFYRWREFRTRRQLRHSEYLIAGSRWAVRSWEELGLAAGRGLPLPYPLDLDRFTPARRDFPHDRGVVLLHLGRLVPRKRLDLLLEAFQLLRRDEPEARLRIIGHFGYALGYQALLKDPALMAGVEYRPQVPRAEAMEALRQADVLVQPSENENFGTAVAEAQACGLPVVLGPTNGTGDYLDTQEFAFAAYEPPLVAAALRRAVRAVRERPGEVAASARAAAERHYDSDRIVDRLETFLRGLGGRGERKGPDGAVLAAAKTALASERTATETPNVAATNSPC
jgi:glycosyltransferase involved in cell wall biosynthesis